MATLRLVRWLIAFSVSTASGVKPDLIKKPDGGMADAGSRTPGFLTGVQVQVLLGAYTG